MRIRTIKNKGVIGEILKPELCYPNDNEYENNNKAMLRYLTIGSVVVGLIITTYLVL